MVQYGFNTEEEENIRNFPVPEPPTYTSQSREEAGIDPSGGSGFVPSVYSSDPRADLLKMTQDRGSMIDSNIAAMKTYPGHTTSRGVSPVSGPVQAPSTWRQDLAASTARLNAGTPGRVLAPGERPPEPPVAPDVPMLSPYTLPERGTAPMFEAPEWDEAEINRLSQENSAAPLRTLRGSYQMAAARLPTNPQSRVLLRDALAGYGEGLESIMSGASKTARGEYSDKYGREYQAESTNYESAAREFELDYASQVAQAQQQTTIENQNLMNQYNADYNEFLRTV